MQAIDCFKAVWRFSTYKPQSVSYRSVTNWLKQFPKADRPLLLKLLLQIRYVSERETQELLVKRNQALLLKLERAGIPRNKVIYVQIDDAGSSSPAMLNMLKEAALLESARCHFVDSKDVRGLIKHARDVGEGAVIYVDDFVGTGNQFCRSRDFAAPYLQGTFSEFLLSVCICEEALYKLGERGVEAFPGFLHSITERPLHENLISDEPEQKERLLALGRQIDKKGSLGFEGLATMVVFYRNAPNSLPVIFRGNVRQNRYVGVLPRTTDLPAS